jgi:flagellar motor switch/type III secretory pathway protein FliN
MNNLHSENHSNPSLNDELEHGASTAPVQQDGLSQQHLLDNLMFNLNAQAGQISLSMQQLLNLASGQVVDLAPLPPKVQLLINGVIIGDGYLVEINGRLGVKIANLNISHVKP